MTPPVYERMRSPIAPPKAKSLKGEAMTIEYEQGPCGTCPVQAEGRINGLPFYFRSRGGSWSLSIAATSDGDPLGDEDIYFHCEPYNGVNSDDFKYGAGYANAEESKSFIERAAKLLLGE